MRDTKALNLSCNIVSLQVVSRCFTFFTLCDQLVAQGHATKIKLLQVEEMQRADWLICLVWIQDKLRACMMKNEQQSQYLLLKVAPRFTFRNEFTMPCSPILKTARVAKLFEG